MSRAANQNVVSIIAISLVVGLCAGSAILFTLFSLGLPKLEATVFGLLGGFTIGAFIYRERSLTNSFEHFRSGKNYELVQYEKRIQFYYSRSLVCLAYFDAGSLLVDKVSPGFLQLLRIPPDLNVRGKSIVELLHITPSSLEAIISEAQHENYILKPSELKLQDSEGNQLKVEVTVEYLKDQHMVEAAFFLNPSLATEGDEEDVTTKDLDRFRRGMYRRETRIIELKEEVNEILKGFGKKPRYGFDQKSKDTHFPTDNFVDKKEAN